ncbi:unnamed protein product [Alternaria sp. RS040]
MIFACFSCGHSVPHSNAFNAKLCATACKETTKWALEDPPTEGKPRLCRYFNTYILLQNGVSQGQYCSMYTQEWDASFATNDGQYRGDDHYTIQYSFGFTDESDDGVPVCPNDISYLKSSGQQFCSSYINYEQPTTTATATATTTPAPLTNTITRTSTSYTTAITTVTAVKFAGRHARRADNGTEVSHDIIVDPYEISIVAVQTISPEDTGKPKLSDTMAAELHGGAIQKRDLVTPASIAAWPRPTAPSYTKIVGGEPSEGVPMVPGPADGRHWQEQFSLALPFPVKIFETSSTQISIAVRGYITVGPYAFNEFADELYVYGPGLFYRVDGAIGSRKIHFSWFTGSYYWGHERFHITATFHEAKPGILVSKIYDNWGQVTPRRTISVTGNGKNIRFAQYWSDNVHEGQEITFDTTGAGGVSAKDSDRIDCCKKTGWEWHVCSEV